MQCLKIYQVISIHMLVDRILFPFFSCCSLSRSLERSNLRSLNTARWVSRTPRSSMMHWSTTTGNYFMRHSLAPAWQVTCNTVPSIPLPQRVARRPNERNTPGVGISPAAGFRCLQSPTGSPLVTSLLGCVWAAECDPSSREWQEGGER